MTDRVRWPDVARALCIILVVERHVTLYSDQILHDGAIQSALLAFTEFFRPFRIPLFFVISGYLVRRWVRKPWSRELVTARIGRLYYLYLLWLALTGIVFWLVPGDLGDLRTWWRVLLFVFVGLTPLWYLWALAAYFVATKLLARWPVVALLVSGALSVVAFTRIIPNYENSTQVMQSWVFFAAGALLPQAVDWLAGTATWLRTATVGAVFVVASGVTTVSITLRTIPFVAPVVSVVAIAFGIMLASLVADRMPRWWSRIGQDTLPIYVLHLVVIVPVVTVLPVLPIPAGPVFVTVATVLTVAICLLAYRVVNPLAPWLFALPRRQQTKRSLSSHPQSE